MISYFSRHLSAKLFLSYLAIILVGIFVLVIAGESILPTSFNRHMRGMMGGGMGNGMMSAVYTDYRASFNETLFYAAGTALVAAMVLSLIFSQRVVAPVRAISLSAQRIAEGHYDERVHTTGSDELSQLVTRFNQMAEKLDQVEAMRRQLIGDVSHELRTPLTAIKGSMEGLIDGVLPATQETYEQIHAEADRLNRLVDDLQELSRVEARAFPLSIQPVKIPLLIQTAIKRLSPKAESKRITLESNISPELPQVLADEDRVTQILVNLIGNAVQYTPEHGKIIVRATGINHEVQVSVQDNGIGISSEHLPYIFDRFYRVDKSRSRRTGGGSGIGLTIVRALVEMQGGRIWVESPGEGRGSKFVFTLPIGNVGSSS